MDDRTLKWHIQRGFRGFAWTPFPPKFYVSYENEIIWSHWDQIISFSWNIFKELRYNKQSESQHVYTSEPHFQKSRILWRIQRGFRGFAWTPFPPKFLRFLWKWNKLFRFHGIFFKELRYNQQSESQHVYNSEPHFQKSWILWRIQRGIRGFAWTPSTPIFLHILWKWNYLVSLRPNHFVFMGYF